MKKFIVSAFIALMLMLTTTAFAKSIEFTIDDNLLYISEQGITTKTLETAPFVTQGRTMVPVRVVAENFGATVTWDEATSTVGISSGDINITLTINSDKAYVNGVEKTLDVPATEINGRTLVPIRFVSESLNYKVDYNDEFKTVYITDEEVVLTVGDIEYNVDDVNAFLYAFSYANGKDQMYETVMENFKQFAVFANESNKTSAIVSPQYLQWVSQFKDVKSEYQKFMLLTPCAKIMRIYSEAVDFTTTLYGEVTDAKIDKLYSDEFVCAKHILLLTKNQETGASLTDEAKKDVKRKMQDILLDINTGADFDTLMNKFSEDTGLQANPNGYVFTKGMMVKEFEDAAYGLKVGEVSQIIETTYGYHIIKKERLPEISDEIKQFISAQVFNNVVYDRYEALCKNYNIDIKVTADEFFEVMSK